MELRSCELPRDVQLKRTAGFLADKDGHLLSPRTTTLEANQTGTGLRPTTPRSARLYSRPAAQHASPRRPHSSRGAYPPPNVRVAAPHQLRVALPAYPWLKASAELADAVPGEARLAKPQPASPASPSWWRAGGGAQASPSPSLPRPNLASPGFTTILRGAPPSPTKSISNSHTKRSPYPFMRGSPVTRYV